MPKPNAAKRTSAPKGNQPASTKTPKQAAEAKAPKAAKPLNECRCGCGRLVKGAFAQGHDARAYGMVLRGELPESTLDGQAGLLSKLAYARRQADAKATRQAEAKAAKAAATPEPQTPDAEAQPEAEPTTSARQRRGGRRPSRVSG